MIKRFTQQDRLSTNKRWLIPDKYSICIMIIIFIYLNTLSIFDIKNILGYEYNIDNDIHTLLCKTKVVRSEVDTIIGYIHTKVNDIQDMNVILYINIVIREVECYNTDIINVLYNFTYKDNYLNISQTDIEKKKDNLLIMYPIDILNRVYYVNNTIICHDMRYKLDENCITPNKDIYDDIIQSYRSIIDITYIIIEICILIIITVVYFLIQIYKTYLSQYTINDDNSIII